MKESKIPRQEIILLLVGLTGLITLQLIFTRAPFYDEDDYLLNVALLHKYGFGKDYLVNLIGSAGPLYSVVHYIFEPITGLKAPYIRLVNTGFLAGVTYFVYLTLRILNFQGRFYALYVLAIPMTYVVAGLALTEMPAIFFFSAAIYLIIKSMAAPGKYMLPQLITAGICMSLAILGRQPFLLTLAALPVLFFSKENYKRNIGWLAITILFSIALPCYVFVTWNGLVPTIESQLYIDIAHAGISYRPDFFLSCVFYFAMSMLLISPRFLSLPPGKYAPFICAICCIIIFAGNFIFDWVELLPMNTSLKRILITPRYIYAVSIVCGSAVIFLGLYFLLCVFMNLQKFTFSRELLFFAAAALLIAAACAKITWGFSSRYAGQAIPLLVLMGSYTYKNSKYNLAGVIIGVLTGLVSLYSYFAFIGA